MGGFSREKSLLVTLEPARHPSARPVKNLSPAEPNLLFVTLTAKATSVPVRPARKAGDLKAGSRIKIETRLWNTTEDRLPPSLRPPSDSQKDAVPPVVYSLAAVYSPAAMTELFESTSGEQFSIGPEKVIHPDGRYYVEASGPLIYPAGSVPASAGAKKKKPVKEAETLDLQLEVKAQVEEGSIDLDIVLLPLKVSDPPRTALQDLSDRAVGASALVWKTPELSATEAPKWRTNRVVQDERHDLRWPDSNPAQPFPRPKRARPASPDYCDRSREYNHAGRLKTRRQLKRARRLAWCISRCRRREKGSGVRPRLAADT